ncbi:MAG: restriction endonuclease [Bacteroidetes bacterium]|nr:restriction endonuclease [Bacteroidota bacterium]
MCEQFEHFVSLVFQSIGFNNVNKRVIDKSLNEVDLIIRNDIEDSFLSKFGKYILVECKNKPKEKVDKNTFIVFNSKL